MSDDERINALWQWLSDIEDGCGEHYYLEGMSVRIAETLIYGGRKRRPWWAFWRPKWTVVEPVQFTGFQSIYPG